MVKVSMPQLGESVTEGTIGRWLKQPGETVEKYEPLVEVTTDKVNAEVPSPLAGTLQEIIAEEGATVAVGAQIAIIAAAGEMEAASPNGGAVEAVPEPASVTNQAAGEASGPATAVVDTAREASVISEAEWPIDRNVSQAVAAAPRFGSATGGASMAPVEPDAGETGGRRRFTPLVLRLAEQHDLSMEELGQLQGTGLGGRVSKNDVLAYIEQRGKQPTAAPAPVAPPAQPEPAPAPAAAAAAMPQATPGELVPLTPMRKAIAEHMVRSLRTSPHAWTTVEVDMTALARYRTAKQDEFRRRKGFSLSYVPFVIEAVVGALQEFPVLNASFTDGGIEIKREVNIGVAVALENQAGLVVPVIKRAGEKNLVGLAHALRDLVARARANKLTMDDLQGGTFTVNNPGTFGSILSQPIINQPQAAILTMEAIVKRPVVITDPATETDMIAIRQMMNMCLSFDHRVLDGLTAGQFLTSIKRRLEGFRGGPGL